ncbi:TonB-dependent receptor [Marinilabiliaceae bacterium JC017]|nr:TonB-dependent receptor [Marinilabiliaceae bacterium JC017]
MLEKYVKIMIFIGVGLFLPRLVFAQNVLTKWVSVPKEKGSTYYYLQQLQDSTGYVFSYSNKLCFKDNVNFSFTEGYVKDFLNRLFDDCPSSYLVRGKKIIIEPLELPPPKFTISGFVRDGKTGESLIGANIYEPDLLLGTVSNNFGFFSVTLPKGYTVLKSSYVGYKGIEQSLYLSGDTTVYINLTPKLELNEVSVVGSRVPAKVKSTRTGTIDLPIEQIRNVPVFLGEQDVVKGIQLLPGVQSGREGFSGLYVRGGGPDQNLIILDDVPVYNVGHLLGFFSVFNADAINKVSVVKGGFPARYGGRLSSVVDVRMYEGSNERINGSASIGLLSSRVALNGPIKKDKATFSLSFRRTYLDLVTAPFQRKEIEKSNYYFFDLNGKVNYKFSDTDRLFVSAYWGKDEFYSRYNDQNIDLEIGERVDIYQSVTLNDESSSGWGNVVAAMRWNHIFGDKLFSNLTATFSDYRFYIGQIQNLYYKEAWSAVEKKYFSGIRDFNTKIDFDFVASPNHYFRFGGSYVYHNFYPGIDLLKNEIANEAQVDTTIGGDSMYRPEFHGYLEDDFNVSDRLKMNLGVHFSLFLTQNDFYHSVEPRISLRYLLSDYLSLKGAYSKMTQYVHLLRTATVSLPTDMWLPVSDEIKPMRASQSSLGFEWEISKGFNLSVEGYYKKFENLLSYKEDGSFFDFTIGWEDKLISGKGTSYGTEFLLHKRIGKLTGWLGYTYSKSFNKFDGLNDGREFPSFADRRHDASLFMSYRFNDRIDGGFTWMFGTGSPVTLPSGKYYAPELPTTRSDYKYNEYINEYNGYRMPNFHRLDFGFNFKKQKKWGERIWSLGMINAYGRQNPFFLYFADSVNDETEEEYRSLKQFSLFPFPIPYVRYTIKF